MRHASMLGAHSTIADGTRGDEWSIAAKPAVADVDHVIHRQETVLSGDVREIGGLLGAFFVAATVTLVPRLGVAMTFSLIVAGQMIVTLIIDHYGLLGVPVKEVNLARIAGIVLIAGGVVLIRKF